MFDEPEDPDAQPAEQASDPKARAGEKTDEFRMHAEVAAVFEGTRKFEARVLPGLDADLARDVQRTMARLAKSRTAEHAVLPESSAADAARLLDLPASADLSTNDYHVYRRPGEVMIVRLLQGDEVDTYYERLQKNFDAALEQHREEERNSKAWKQDPRTLAYLDALDALELNMSTRYLREPIREHKLFVLSDQSADEFNLLYLTDLIMQIDAAELVGSVVAPGEESSDQDRAWFFKLFALRGMKDEQERMCFFAYLQKSDDEF